MTEEDTERHILCDTGGSSEHDGAVGLGQTYYVVGIYLDNHYLTLQGSNYYYFETFS